MNGSTGTVVDPNGPFTSKDDSLRDKNVFGGRGIGVAPGYEDLAGVVQNRRLHADHARRVPTLIVSPAEEGKGTSRKTKERALGFHGRLRQIQEMGSKDAALSALPAFLRIRWCRRFS